MGEGNSANRLSKAYAGRDVREIRRALSPMPDVEAGRYATFSLHLQPYSDLGAEVTDKDLMTMPLEYCAAKGGHLEFRLPHTANRMRRSYVERPRNCFESSYYR